MNHKFHRPILLAATIIIVCIFATGIAQIYHAKQLDELGESATVIINQPILGNTLKSPLLISGKTNVPGTSLNVQLVDNQNIPVFEKKLSLSAPGRGGYRAFSQEMFLPDLAKRSYAVHIFWMNPYTKKRHQSIFVPLSHPGEPAFNIRLYFANRSQDPDESCERVYPVERAIFPTEKHIEAALHFLSEGPSPSDATLGYTSALHAPIAIVDTMMEDGVVIISTKGSDALSSCQKRLLTAQLTETVRQFPSVQQVTITAENNKLLEN